MLKWSQIDPNAKPNSTPVCDVSEPWAQTSDLKISFPEPTYATVCELNQTLLNEEQLDFPAAPASVKWGLFTSTLSGADGTFETPPVLDVSFSAPVDSAGITLTFYDVYPRSMQVVWYSGETILCSETFSPDGFTYFAARAVYGYDRVTIAFNNLPPFRRLKLMGVEYGRIKILKDQEIVKYSITENVNECSAKIAVNTASLEIFAEGTTFDFVTNAGDYNLIKEKQPVEDMEGYGTFYVKKISAKYSNLSLDLTDLLDVIGDIKFYGGMYDTTLGEFVNELAEAANTAAIFGGEHNGFDITNEVAAIPLKGYVPITTVRNALQMACIACCVVCDTSRSDKIRLYPKHISKTADIPDETIVQGDKTESNELFTGVSVTAYHYVEEDSSEKIFSAKYNAGTHTVEFSAPHTISTSGGGTIIASGVNFVTFTVAEDNTTVWAHGDPFVATEQEYTKTNPNARGSVPNIKSMAKNTLVNPENVENVAQNYLEYYAHQYKSEYTTLTPYQIGAVYKANNITGNLEKQNIDRITELSKAVLCGDYIPDNG